MPIEPVTALLKELTIKFAVCYRPDEFRETITAFTDRTIDPTPVIGPTLGLNRIAEAFDLVRSASVNGRVLVSPSTLDSWLTLFGVSDSRLLSRHTRDHGV